MSGTSHALVLWKHSNKVSTMKSAGIPEEMIRNTGSMGKVAWQKKNFDAIVLHVGSKVEISQHCDEWVAAAKKKVESDSSENKPAEFEVDTETDQINSDADADEEKSSNKNNKKPKPFELHRVNRLMETIKTKKSVQQLQVRGSTSLGSNMRKSQKKTIKNPNKSPKKTSAADKNISATEKTLDTVANEISPTKSKKTSGENPPHKTLVGSKILSPTKKATIRTPLITTYMKPTEHESESSDLEIVGESESYNNSNLEKRVQILEKKFEKLEKKRKSQCSSGMPEIERKSARHSEVSDYLDEKTLQQIEIDSSDEGQMTKNLMTALFDQSVLAVSSRTGLSSSRSGDKTVQRQKLDPGKVAAIYRHVEKEIKPKTKVEMRKMKKFIGIAFSEKCKEARRWRPVQNYDHDNDDTDKMESQGEGEGQGEANLGNAEEDSSDSADES